MAGLVVRREQMQAFEQALLTKYVNQMAARLRARFPVETSKQVTRLADPDVLRQWGAESQLPSCAIGGITADNLAPLVQSGANLLAIIGGVWGYPGGPAAGVRAINEAIRSVVRE